jgi:formylglycine-generating enzyme required for sulfatase activity
MLAVMRRGPDPECGELVVVPAGSFDMGSTSDFEDPVHRVTIAKPFAMGRREVTFTEWDAWHPAGAGPCAIAGGDVEITRSWA